MNILKSLFGDEESDNNLASIDDRLRAEEQERVNRASVKSPPFHPDFKARYILAIVCLVMAALTWYFS